MLRKIITFDFFSFLSLKRTFLQCRQASPIKSIIWIEAKQYSNVVLVSAGVINENADVNKNPTLYIEEVRIYNSSVQPCVAKQSEAQNLT